MIDLVCKSDECSSVVECEEGVVAVTCSKCCATIGTNMSADDN